MTEILLVVVALQLVAIALEAILYLRIRGSNVEILDVLRVVKGWAYSAKINHSDAKEALREVKEEQQKKPGSDEVIAEKVADKVMSRMAAGKPDLAQAVEEVPEKTADRVVEKLEERGG